MTGTFAILRIVAKRLGTRIKKTNCYDSNVCKAEFSAETKWEPKVLSGHPFSQEVRATYRDHRIVVMANPDYICCTVYGQPGVDLCSINRPDKVMCVTEPSSLSVCGDPRWPVFLPARRQPSEKLRRFLEDPACHKMVQEVIGESSGSLHFVGNAVQLYTEPKSADEVIDAIDALSSLVGAHISETMSVDFTVLPASLHGLIRLIKRWAVTDDGERDALLEEASEAELSDLITTVEPLLGEIDDYLRDSTEGSLPAVCVGAIAECTVEARLYLDRHSKGNR